MLEIFTKKSAVEISGLSNHNSQEILFGVRSRGGPDGLIDGWR